MLATLVLISPLIHALEIQVMQIYRASIAFCLCATLCQAQATKTDQALLNKAREKYDAPFNMNLQSFDCAVDFSWKEHFKETTRVGDEGTDEEVEKFIQPIRNRVTVTRQSVAVSSGLTDEAEAKLPHGGMAEGLLKHAVQKSLYTWLDAATNMMLPNSDVPVSFKRYRSGYKLTYKVQTSDVEMALDSDMRLQNAALRGPQPTRFGTSFAVGPHGFLLSSISRFEDGDATPGHRLSFAYTYQTVDGIQLPDQVVVIRESHHEVWQYRLSDCVVRTNK